MHGWHTPSRSQKEGELGIRSHRRYWARQCSRQHTKHPLVGIRSRGWAFLREWPSLTLYWHHRVIRTASNRQEELRMFRENGQHDTMIFNNELLGKFWNLAICNSWAVQVSYFPPCCVSKNLPNCTIPRKIKGVCCFLGQNTKREQQAAKVSLEVVLEDHSVGVFNSFVRFSWPQWQNRAGRQRKNQSEGKSLKL